MGITILLMIFLTAFIIVPSPKNTIQASTQPKHIMKKQLKGLTFEKKEKKQTVDIRNNFNGCKISLPPKLYKKIVAEDPFSIMRGRVDMPYLCLTFDGSAHHNGVSEILKILSQKNIKATFFLSGEFLRSYPKDVKEIVKAGHEVGNHLFHHIHLTTWALNHKHNISPGITKLRFQQLLIKNEKLFHEITGAYMVHLWRAPYGETNPIINRWAAECGYVQVSWTRNYQKGLSMDTLDWVWQKKNPLFLNAYEIEKRILDFDCGIKGGANGAIILMHTGSFRTSDFPWTVLGEIIDSMEAKGYKFVKVSRLIEGISPELATAIMTP